MEVSYKTLVRPQLEYAPPTLHPDHDTQIGQVEKLPGGHAGNGETQLTVGECWTNLSSLVARREPSSLTCFYKIHAGTVCLEKDKDLIPAPNLSRKQGHLTTHSTLYILPIVMP